MSSHILVIGDRVKHCSRATAKRKVERGAFRWRDQFTIEPAQVQPRSFCFGPSAAFRDWSPRNSAGFLVMQLRTGHS